MKQSNEKSLVPIGEVIDNTPVVYQHAPYRNLTEQEIEMLVALLYKHRGSLEAVRNDPDSPVKGNSNIYYYKRKYSLLERLGEYRRQIVEKFKAESANILAEAKVKALQRAMELLEDREIEISKGDLIIKYTKKPDYKEIQCAWEIIKNELGETTTIIPAELTDQTNRLNDLINRIKNKNAQTVIAPTNRGGEGNSPLLGEPVHGPRTSGE